MLGSLMRLSVFLVLICVHLRRLKAPTFGYLWLYKK